MDFIAHAQSIFQARLRQSDQGSVVRDWGADLALREVGLPDWWGLRGNRFLAAEDAPIPLFHVQPGGEPPSNALLVIERGHVPAQHYTIWGDWPAVYIGPGVALNGGEVACGGNSTIYLEGGLSVMMSPNLNARNGGLISVGRDNLWSSRVSLFTDDMHAILDAATGVRINAYGGTVSVGEHVWLGFDTLLLPGASIGRDCVLGARSVVTGRLDAGSICVGAPARAIRSGVTWSHQDIPPPGAA